MIGGGRLRGLARSVAVVAAIAAGAGCRDDHRARPRGGGPAVVADAGAAVEVVHDAAPASWVGVIASAEAVDVAPPFDGVIARVVVRPGDVVTAGQVVAELDERPLREELAAAKAALREARAGVGRTTVEVQSAQRRVQREEHAVADGTSARATLEEAKFALDAAKAAATEARAAVGQAQTRVDRADSRLGQTALRAPFAGTVGARYRDAGASVGPASPVVRIVGGGGLRLRFAVAPEAARLLAPGARVEAQIDTVAAPVGAVVEQIAPEVDQSSQLVFVDAALDGDGAGLQPGLAARVTAAAAPEAP
ncbi:MAG: efflux RND transporter periplasmic adaptor subunit [Kofleriaceae bacterium]|nr:efflux RND transporter periplasmic adaptor subunit [Kofleriaceae bacterium]